MAPRPGSPLVTIEGDVVGTPAYMSPEQASGRLDEMGPASDVYSAGAMLYELLAGHMPYALPGRRASGLEIWFQVQQGPPEPLQERAPDAPPELVAICERAMARDWRVRYPDMGALARDLSAFLERRVVSAYETGTWAETRKWVQRNKPLALALAAAFATLLAGFVVSSVLKRESDRNATLAEERRRQADESAERERIRADEVLRLSALQDLDDLRVEAGELWPATPERIDAYERWVARASALLADLPLHVAKRDELGRAGTGAIEERAPGDAAASQARWWESQLDKLIGELGGLTTGLLSEADDAATPAYGWSVPRRLAFARSLARDFADGGALATSWDAALPAIREAYGALELAPQIGLAPLGPDPGSGLWEFADLATGAAPERDAQGTLALTEASAVVLVLLPGGTFAMGAQASDPDAPNHDRFAKVNEQPVHALTLPPFFVSKYELTQAQWRRMTGENPSDYRPDTGLVETLLHPVEQVSWLDATRACGRLGLALPTEAQWEYAARGGTTTPWWTGAERETLAGSINLADQTAVRSGAAWPSTQDWPELDDGHTVHAPVDAFEPNPFGLHAVIGNVWEWCADEGYRIDYRPDVEVLTSRRTIRGGSFYEAAFEARSSTRSHQTAAYAVSTLGLRPVRPFDG